MKSCKRSLCRRKRWKRWAGWQAACIVAAVLGFITTICVSFSQQLKIGDRLLHSNLCAGRLKLLDTAIATGSRGWDEISKEYEEVVKTFPDSIR